jgi:uncharacterized membrane protein
MVVSNRWVEFHKYLGYYAILLASTEIKLGHSILNIQRPISFEQNKTQKS